MTDCTANEDFSPATSMASSIEPSQSQTPVDNGMKENENQQCLEMYNNNEMGETDNSSHISVNDSSKVDGMECGKEEFGVLRNNNIMENKNEEDNENHMDGQMSMGMDPSNSMQNQNHNQNHGEFGNSEGSQKELVTTHRSPVIASHISICNISEVVNSPVITNSNNINNDNMMEQKQNSLPNQMLSRSNAVDLQDESQDSGMDLKQNDQMESEVDMEVLSRDQLHSDRIILHGGSYLHDGNKQISALVNSYNLPRSSPSSVTAPVICMAPSSHLNSLYDSIPRGQGLPPVSTIIRSTSMARYDRANLHSMSNSHSSILPLPTSTESLHTLDISRMNIMTDDSLAPSNMSIRNMECFSPPHRSVLVTPTSSHLRSHIMDQNNSVPHQQTHSPSPSHCDSSKDDRVELENMHANNSHIQESKSNSDNNNMIDQSEDDQQQQHQDLNDYEQSDSIESLRQKYITTSVVSPNPSNSYTEHFKEFANSQFLPMAAIGGLPTNRITPEMAEMLNSMVQKSVASLSRDNNLDIGAEMMGDLIQTSIQSAPSSLIISPHQNQQLQRLIINAGTGTSLSSDETSEGSSPLLSVDSDMECKVQDLTRRSMGIDRKHLMVIQGDNQQTNTCIATHGTPQNLVQSFSRGVITSVMSNNGNILQLCQSNMGEEIETSKSSELMDNGEAEDLSHPSKINCSMSMAENSGVIKNSENEQSSPETSSPLQNVPSSMLPSFLSSLASLSGIPLSLPTSTTVPYASPTDSSLQASPSQPVILSSVSNANSLSNVKQEPGSRLNNISCNITSSSGNVYTNLPNLQTMAPYIKQEVPSPSGGSLPPFPVISALKRDAHTSSSMRNSILSSQTTHPIMSVVQTTSGTSLSGFMGGSSHHQLPPYSSMRVSSLPPLNIPGASSSSESPASSPMTGGIPSDASPISLSPGKKNEKLKELGSMSVGGTGSTMSPAEVVNSLMLQGKEKDPRRWSCPMCRNGSPCGLHPTQMQMATSSLSPGPMPSGDPAKPYQCTVCGKNLASKNVFQLHMRSHSGEKPFRCNLCGHHFSQKTSLTRHMRSHTGERPFPCTVCGKRFADKERIKIHMRTHTGEKPFSCDVCAKRFSQKSTVKRHMSVHTGEKPFKCEACGKGFANRGNLNAHAKTHANS